MSIEAKTTAMSPRSPGLAHSPAVSGSPCRNASVVSAAAGEHQQCRQESIAFSAPSLQPVQSSGSAAGDAHTPDSTLAEHIILSPWSQPLSPEPDVFTPQPQALSAQPYRLTSEHTCNAALSADSCQSLALSCPNTQPQSPPTASVPAAAEAAAKVVVPLAGRIPSGMHTAQTEAAKLGPAIDAAQGSARLQLAHRHSIAQQSIGLEVLTAAASVSSDDSPCDASSGTSMGTSPNASSNEQGSQVLTDPSSMHPNMCRPLKPAALAAGTGPALAAVQGPPVAVLQTSSLLASKPPSPEAGREAGQEADAEAEGEVSVAGRMEKADVEGSKGAGVEAGRGVPTARLHSGVERVVSHVDQEQSSSTLEPPSDTFKASDSGSSVMGFSLEQRPTVSSGSFTGRVAAQVPSLCSAWHCPLFCALLVSSHAFISCTLLPFSSSMFAASGWQCSDHSANISSEYLPEPVSRPKPSSQERSTVQSILLRLG